MFHKVTLFKVKNILIRGKSADFKDRPAGLCQKNYKKYFFKFQLILGVFETCGAVCFLKFTEFAFSTHSQSLRINTSFRAFWAVTSNLKILKLHGYVSFDILNKSSHKFFRKYIS